VTISMPVTIVTDSSCDLPQDLLQQTDIRIVPCSVSFGDRTYRDGIDIDREQFYEMLIGETFFPTTSQPSVSEFQELFSSIRDGGQEVVAVLLSGRLSATVNSATQAKNALDENGPIDIIDSEQTSMGLGFMALEAAKLASEGASREDIVAKVLDVRSRTHTFAMLDTAEYLRRGGRAGRAQSFLVSALQFKPIVTISEGVAAPVARPRTRRKGLDEIASRLQNLAPLERAAVMYTTDQGDTEAVGERIASAANVEVVQARFSPVLGAHIGPRALGAAVVRAG
jgi:DegV family protein with EDD domain